MKTSANDKARPDGEADEHARRTLIHDIKNQLSNINMALEQLRFEVPDASDDCVFYMDSISMSSAKINKLIAETA